MSLVIISAILIFLFVIGLFAWKITSESKAKKNYKPPIANEKIVLPEMRDEQLPAKSRNNLRFCPLCGTANSDQSICCTNCGAKF